MTTKPYTIQPKRSLLNEFKNIKESMSTFTKRKHLTNSLVEINYLLEEFSQSENPNDENKLNKYLLWSQELPKDIRNYTEEYEE